MYFKTIYLQRAGEDEATKINLIREDGEIGAGKSLLLRGMIENCNHQQNKNKLGWKLLLPANMP